MKVDPATPPLVQSCRQCGRTLERDEIEDVCAVCLWGWFSADEPGARVASSGKKGVLLEVPGHDVFEEIARGGMGIVYRARQIDPEREVALKMLLPHQLGSLDVAQRFHLEARTLADLEHPAILPVYQSGSHDGMPFFTMKLAPGGTLGGRKDQLAGQWQAIAELVATVADAVHFAHERGVLHRDLKPGNILFDEQSRPYVSDFGLAKLLDGESSLTRTIDLLGTPHYMAPEVAAGSARQATTASDIYSLGAVLYELLAGRPPFEAEGVPALLKKIVEQEPVAPSKRGANRSKASPAESDAPSPHAVPRDLEVICLKCLAKEPARRYLSARDLAEDLRRFTRDEPIQARPVTGLERFGRWCRQNPVLACISAALVVAVLAGFTGVFTQWQRAEIQRRRAEDEALFTRLNLYTADILAAHHALRRGDYGFVRRLLAAHRPAPGQEDVRGFEWRLLWTLSRGEQERLLRGHTDTVTSVAYSPDAATVASASMDGTVRLWNSRTGASGPVLKVDGQGALSVAFSADGAFMATGGVDEGAKLWRVNGTLVRTFPGQHARVAFHPRAPILAVATEAQSAEENGSVEVWKIDSNELLYHLSESGGRIAFSADGRMLATAGDVGKQEGRIVVWDAASGVKRRTYPIDRVESMVFSFDGTHLLASRGQGGVTRCDFDSGFYKDQWSGDAGNACALAGSPNGVLLAEACYDHTIRFAEWGMAPGREPGLRGHTREPGALAFAPDGNHLASGGLDKTVRLWNVGTNSAWFTRLHDIGATPRFAPGSSLIAYRLGREVRLWDLKENQEMALLPLKQPLGFTDRGRVFVGATSAPVAIQFWDTVQRSLIRSVPLEGGMDKGGINASLDCTLVYMRDGAAVGVWETATGRQRCHIRGPWKQTFGARFSPDSRTIAVSVDDGDVVIWDTVANGVVRQFKAHPGVAGRLDFSADGKLLATAGGDGMIKIWETETWTEKAALYGHRSAVWGVSFAPDGKTLVASSYGQVLLWHVPTRRTLFALVDEGGDESVAFSPNGDALIAEMRGHTAQVWRAAPLAECDAEMDLEQANLSRTLNKAR